MRPSGQGTPPSTTSSNVVGVGARCELTIMRVPVGSGDELAPGVARELIEIDAHDAAGSSFAISPDGRWAVVYHDRYKYIHSSDGAHELYDLESDSEETTNLVAEHPSRVESMQNELAK